MSKKYDLIVIGTGSSASVAAGKCANAGWNVAQIDYRPFGGTCALRGCDPKKVLAGIAELVDWTRRMKGLGIRSGTTIDWNELMQFKRTFTDPVPQNREEEMKKKGIAPYQGKARFLSPNTLEVNGEELIGKKVLIATGAKPDALPIEGFDHLITSTDFLELEELPPKIVFAGGGYISFEFAHIAARAGSEIMIIHRGKRPLEAFDPDMVNILLEKTRDIGIDVRLNAEVTAVHKKETGFEVHASSNNKNITIEADLVVHGAGRVPEIENLDLPKGNVERDQQGISVNEYLQSISNPDIYAAGDAVSSAGKPLTPIAGFESHIVASNLLKGNQQKAEYPAQPSVVFTTPALSTVGLTEKKAKDQGLKVNINFGHTDNWYSSKRINESFSGYKTLVDIKTDKIVGAHFVGEHAPELINMIAIAINQGITTKELKQMIFAYPTHGSDLAYMI